MKKIIFRFVCLIIPLFLSIILCRNFAIAEVNTGFLQLGGDENQDPLCISVYSNGSMSVEVWQPEFPFSFDYDYIHQYAATDSWGSNLYYTSGGEGQIRCFTDYYRQTNTPEIAVQLDLGDASLSASGNWITAEWQTDQLKIIQIITYETQSWSFGQTWQITSQVDVPLQNLMFTHGGDTSLGGVDQVCSSWHEQERLLSIWPEDLSLYGPMFFRSQEDSLNNNYFGGLYWQGYEQVTAGLLNNTTSSAYVDSAALLQWQKNELLPGETWTIGCRQQFNPPGYIQITEPELIKAEPGDIAVLDFTVFYLGAADPALNWDAATGDGWDVNVAASDAEALPGEPGGYMLELAVSIEVPATAPAGHVEEVLLTVMHDDDPWTEYRAPGCLLVQSSADPSGNETAAETDETETGMTSTVSPTTATSIDNLSPDPEEETTPVEAEEIVQTGNSGYWNLIGTLMLIIAFVLSWVIYIIAQKKGES